MLTPLLISFIKGANPNRAAAFRVANWGLTQRQVNWRCLKRAWRLKTSRLHSGEKITARAAPSICKPNLKIKNQSISTTHTVSVKVAIIVRLGLPSLRTKLIVM